MGKLFVLKIHTPSLELSDDYANISSDTTTNDITPHMEMKQNLNLQTLHYSSKPNHKHWEISL